MLEVTYLALAPEKPIGFQLEIPAGGFTAVGYLLLPRRGLKWPGAERAAVGSAADAAPSLD